MKILHLSCNHCGAPLDVFEGTKFATCRFCSSRLAIEHSDTASYTRVLDALQQHASTVSRDLQTIKVQNQIEQLDREWQVERENACRRGKSGRLYEPTVVDAGCLAIVQIIFGLAWFLICAAGASASGSSFLGMLSLLGLVIGGMAIMSCVHTTGRARQFQEAKAAYEVQRQGLVDALAGKTLEAGSGR